MSDLAECIRRYEASLATRPPGRPVRVIRAANLTPAAWKSDARITSGGRNGTEVHFSSSGDTAMLGVHLPRRCAALAETGAHLGLDRVGLVIETVEEATP